MEKVVWLLWGSPDEPVDVVDRLRSLAADPSVVALTVNQHDTAASAATSPAPGPEGEAVHVAQVSAFVASYQRRSAIEDAVAGIGLPYDAYLVVESLVDDYGTTQWAAPRSWPDGQASPGVLTVAILHRPEQLTEAEWLHRWHEIQSPVSGELQPRTRYVRNHVVRPLTKDAPEVHGIVEEGWPSADHVTDPMLFFNAGGDVEQMNRNVERMMGSVTACLDLDRLRSTTMTEFLLKGVT